MISMDMVKNHYQKGILPWIVELEGHRIIHLESQILTEIKG